MRRLIIVLAVAGLSLSACGRRGELYFPEPQGQSAPSLVTERQE